ncbi:hypothetical protein OAG69_00160 [bacterium]|nr:hypothetical protein [bacterium]
MMAPLASESLDLDPANPSTLDIITATRAGTATYTDASGNIQTASPNTVRVDHVQGEQLTPAKYQRVGYTDFSSGWGSASSQAGDGYLGNASRIVSFNGFGIYNHQVATDNTKTYKASIYLRITSGDSSLIRLFHQLQSGSGGSNSVIAATTDWQRFDITLSSTGTFVNFGVAVFSGGSVEVEIAMPQVEEGTTASDFVENTTGSPKLIAAATYAPRVPMILVEPAATNLIVNSEDFSQDVTLSNCTVQSGFTAPDASSNAYKLIEDNTNSLKLFRANNNTNTTASTSYSSSIFVKAGERTKVRIYGYHLTNQFFSVDYDLVSNSSLGTVTSNTQVDGHSIEDCGNGWKRITVTGQKPVSTYSWDVGVSPLDDGGNVTYQGDGTSGVYIWGAQLEQGTVGSSYIPSAGSTVTRAADNLVIDGSDFTNFYNQSEGTVYVEYEPRVLGTTNTALEFSDGSTNNRIFSLAASAYHCYIVDGGVNQAVLDGGTNTAGVLNRLAFSYEANNIQASLDGGAVVNDTSASIPTVDRLTLGRQTVGWPRHLNGRIKRLIYWPHHSDNL